MSALARTNRTLRAVGLLLLGAIVLHWLRYWIAYGEQAASELHRQGHGYLAELLPSLVAIATASILAATMLRVLGGAAGASARRSVMRPAALFGGALVAIFFAQELSEVLLTGRAGGPAGLLGGGGWLAIPLGAPLGLLLAFAEALIVRSEDHLVAVLERRRALGFAPAPAAPLVSALLAPLAARPLAFGLARRPPPGSEG